MAEDKTITGPDGTPSGEQQSETPVSPSTANPFTIGVICNGNNNEDIGYYSNEFRLINKIFEDKVRVLFIGMNGGLLPPNTEYTKPVSINHYFRHLYALKVDLLFIPLIKSAFNQKTEDYKKFTEAALFGIPVITVKQYPYSAIIKDKRNGFLYDEREDFIAYLKELLIENLPDVKMCGSKAYETYLQRLSFTYENTIGMINAFN